MLIVSVVNSVAHLGRVAWGRGRTSICCNAELSRLSHMVGRLEKRGFVRREPDPRNGRYTQAILTKAGYAYLAGAAPGHVAGVLDVFIDVLTPDELRTLHRISDKVLARIEHAQGETTSDHPGDRAATGVAR
ncbi:MarR family winged helix-turn-helix transcriptional regulator [Streptomyces sp. NPDC048291]|uniref:MarR family winged helix-turn-helix transcriptional regulator n=1 Tax=Streptomyces sp. NPDC048291 TaxID=3365530 RepID=UPI00372234B3